jgi:putative tryptophan/tyrosine transport system substrate-binding protein
MRRRRFLEFLLCIPAGWPITAAAQRTGRIFKIGLVMGGDTPVSQSARVAFVDEMNKAGLIEGRHFVLHSRSNQADSPTLLTLMTDLVQTKVDVIVAGGTEQTLRAAVAASSSIPIVMWANNFDPIAGGYVKSLSRPGGNVTGVFTRQPEIAEKQVELLREMFPQYRHLALLWDVQTTDQFEAASRRGHALGFEVSSHKLENMPYNIPAAFRIIAARNPQLLQVASGPNMGRYQQQIVNEANKLRLPAMYIFKTYVDRGGLISYGIEISSSFRRIAGLVIRIIGGAPPSDLPIEQPTTFELAVNLKTAKAIGIDIPTSILLRASEVIE